MKYDDLIKKTKNRRAVLFVSQCTLFARRMQSTTPIPGSRRTGVPRFSKLDVAFKPWWIRECVLHQNGAPRRELSNRVSIASIGRTNQKNLRKTSAVHKRAAPPLLKFLKNRAESWKVFNMSKMLLLHTHPTVYHTHRLDKRLKSLTLYEIRKRKTELLCFFRLEIALKPWGIIESVLHMDSAPDRYLFNGVSYASFR